MYQVVRKSDGKVIARNLSASQAYDRAELENKLSESQNYTYKRM